MLSSSYLLRDGETYFYLESVAKCRGSWVEVVGRGCGSWVWVWVNVVGKKGIEKK